MQVVRVRAGEWAFRQGEEARGQYLVLSGRIELWQDGSDGATSVGSVSPGGSLGELGVLSVRHDIKARGAASLVAKEVRAKQLTEMVGMAANPAILPFVKFDKLLRLLAKSERTMLWLVNDPRAGQDLVAEPVSRVIIRDPDATADDLNVLKG